VCVRVGKRKCVCAWVSVCERERRPWIVSLDLKSRLTWRDREKEERKREKERGRERERLCVCVCVCVRV